MSETVNSLRRQLAAIEQNLLLLAERKAAYVLAIDVPLQLLKEERALQARQAELQAQVTRLFASSSDPPPAQPAGETPLSVQPFVAPVLPEVVIPSTTSSTVPLPALGTNVCAFVGAGLSMGAGLPGWYDLISELVQRIGYTAFPPRQWATSEALIDAAQAYVNQQGLYSLIEFLKERLDTFNRSPTDAHLALARSSISLIFTANFDDLLEQAYRKVGKRVRLVIRDIDIPFMKTDGDVVNIVKLYGDLSQPDSIVLARQQYEAYLQHRPEMINLLRMELARNNMLYLGWSHTDPYFNFTFGELLTRLGDFMRPGYAVLFDLPTERVQELQRKKLHVVPLPPSTDRTGQIANWLESLLPSTRSPDSPSSVGIAQQPTREYNYQWSPLLGKPRLEDEEAVSVLLQARGFQHNPFGPLQAELDRYLSQFWYISPKYEMALLGDRPAQLFAEPGMGKTTYAYWVADSCNNAALGLSAFPVYFHCGAEQLADCQSSERVLNLIGRQVGDQLIPFFALNPQTFLAHKPADKSAIVTTLMTSTRTRDNLLRRLRENGLANDLWEDFAADVDRYSARKPVAVYSGQEWLEILSKARPVGFDSTYFLLDIHSRDLADNRQPESVAALEWWLQQIVPLAANGVYIKLFLPAWLRLPLSQTPLPELSEVLLEWNKTELLEMLIDRLQWASDGQISDINQLFHPRSRRPNSPASRLIEMAQGSSQRLIRLGNRLLEHHANHFPDQDYFTLAELESIG